MATPYNLYRSNTESDESESIIVEQRAVQTSNPSPRAKASSQNNMVTVQTNEDKPVAFLEYDVDFIGKSLYSNTVSTSYPLIRLSLGGVLLSSYVLTPAAVKLYKRYVAKKSASSGAAVALEAVSDLPPKQKAKIWRAFSRCRQAFKSIGAGGGKLGHWAFNLLAVGLEGVNGILALQDLMQWQYDAVGDFAKQTGFMFNPEFPIEDFNDLADMLECGYTPGFKSAETDLTPRQFMLLIMLSSRSVMGVSMGAATIAHIGDFIAAVMKRPEVVSGKMTFADTVRLAIPKIRFAIPGNPNASNAELQEQGRKLLAILTKFDRYLGDVQTTDWEDVVIPGLTVISARLSVFPRVGRLLAGAITQGGEVLFTSTYDEDTRVIVNELLKKDNPSWFDGVFDWLSNVLFGSEEPSVDSKIGGLNG